MEFSINFSGHVMRIKVKTLRMKVTGSRWELLKSRKFQGADLILLVSTSHINIVTAVF